MPTTPENMPAPENPAVPVCPTCGDPLCRTFLSGVTSGPAPAAESWVDVVAAAVVAESEPAEEEERCGTCDETFLNCDCVTCRECDTRLDREDRCRHCSCCEDHCGCPTCPGCDRTAASLCGHCDECAACCSCVVCSSCGELSQDEDGDDATPCSRCGSGPCCCNCTARVLTRHARDPEARFHDSETFTRHASKRHIGCEIEVASIRTFDAVNTFLDGWYGVGVVSDGSLPSTGFELCTPPTNGDLFVDKILGLTKRLNEGSGVVTDVCGLHVHIDARDLGASHIEALIRIWLYLEPAIIRLFPSRRSRGNYAMPLAQWDRIKEIAGSGDVTIAEAKAAAAKKAALSRRVYGQHDERYGERAWTERYSGVRYYALNVHSWFYRGTVEFRGMEGTLDGPDICRWARLCAELVQTAKRVGGTPERCTAFLSRLPADRWAALAKVAPDARVRSWINTRRAKFAEDWNLYRTLVPMPTEGIAKPAPRPRTAPPLASAEPSPVAGGPTGQRRNPFTFYTPTTG